MNDNLESKDKTPSRLNVSHALRVQESLKRRLAKELQRVETLRAIRKQNEDLQQELNRLMASSYKEFAG